ncbi:hypothetical protein [Nissabacter sp. SGAir0207]|uniref:hypothetical protein n=1 Tax=Nissabacter sp. SGAir0207 TaxID=2126321 RepID=UPI0010CD676D|nr:hypothetical protein [Nissabacter sp. SGAir0207]QCR38908.1 hypothetical protein C1N62_22625 [Nissabacter sp. SGAir0207]
MLSTIPLASHEDIAEIGQTLTLLAGQPTSNAQRRALAAQALRAFVHAADTHDEPVESNIQDLMIDLLHLVNHLGLRLDDPTRAERLLSASGLLFELEVNDEEKKHG